MTLIRITDVKQSKERILFDINEVRKQHNLPVVTPCKTLDVPCQEHSENMAHGDFFGHYNPHKKEYPSTRILKAGYDWRKNGGTFREIIIAGWSADYFVEQWMNSYSHRMAILNPKVKDIGIGYFYLPNDKGVSNWYNYSTVILGVR